MKKIKSIIIIVGILFVILLIYYYSSQGIPVQIETVKKGDIYQYVTQRSVTSLPHIYKMTMPFNGRIKEIKTKAGDKVTKGMLVVKLDQNQLKSQIAQTEAENEAIESQIKILQYNAIENTALKESSDWINAMAALTLASQEKVKANEAQYTYSVQYKDAMIGSGQAVSKIQAYESLMKAAVSKEELEQTKLISKTIDIVYTIFKLLPTYINEYLERKAMEENVLHSQLQGNEAKLAQLNRDLAMTQIISPIDGIVLTQYIKNERFLIAGTDILNIGNLKDLEVTADVLTTDSANIKMGDKVELYGGALANTVITGKVIQKEPQAFTKVSSLGVEEQRLNIKISIDGKELEQFGATFGEIGNDFRVYAKIYTAEKKNVLIIPRTALFKDNQNNWQLFTVAARKAKTTTVDVGIINDNFAEITKGLKEGQKIILSPPPGLYNGATVSQ